MSENIVETVYDLDEFLKLIDPNSRIHHECYWKCKRILEGLPLEIEVGIVLYGLTREGFVLKCVITKKITWEEVEKLYPDSNNLYDKYNTWIRQEWAKFEKMAKEIGSTSGKFERLRI